GSLVLAGIVRWIVPDAKVPDFGNVSALFAAFLIVVVSPVFETLIMGAVLLILLRLMPPTWAVIVSAVGWGTAHSLMVPTWGLAIWWPFLIFSTLFVVWRQRSIWLAFGLPVAAHALQNLIPSLLLLIGRT
ncbi:MAG TPA: CPBP family glutamic-type intramembrane protease, partial [Sphingomicrobium sp.]